MKLLKILFVIFSILLLIYMLWPTGPADILDFSPLPNSTKSSLSGDTIQIPNVAGYYSNNYRNFVIPFYSQEFKSFTALNIDPLRLNYPPEYAFTVIKDQTQSTYLEELVYPLRDSLFVNGMEPYDEFTKEPRFTGAHEFKVKGELYETKIVIRYYPSPLWVRVLTWLGITVSIVFLVKMTRKVVFSND